MSYQEKVNGANNQSLMPSYSQTWGGSRRIKVIEQDVVIRLRC